MHELINSLRDYAEGVKIISFVVFLFGRISSLCQITRKMQQNWIVPAREDV